MKRLYLGLDTSNYKTSAGLYCPEEGTFRACGKLLEVPLGTLGLRQSDALFQHIKQLPEQVQAACHELDGQICGIGYSSKPRDLEDSYMPCFLAGRCAAECMGAVLKVPVCDFSHQQGHLAAAAFSVGRPDLLEKPFLAWHLSGGTTELLLVEPSAERIIRAEILGGSTDISAGQLIDRTGQMLSLPFPAGKSLDKLSENAEKSEFFRVKCRDMHFSLSGVQNKVQQYFEKGSTPADTAVYALRSVISAVTQATKQAMEQYPGLPVVFSGGVASNSLLRREAEAFSPVFAEPRYSTDNALGIAVLTYRHLEG